MIHLSITAEMKCEEADCVASVFGKAVMLASGGLAFKPSPGKLKDWSVAVRNTDGCWVAWCPKHKPTGLVVAPASALEAH